MAKTLSLSEQRWAENEVIFRQHNEKVANDLKKLKQRAKAEGYSSLVPDIDFPLHFYCECSDEDCRQRVILKPPEYEKMRKNERQFVLKPGHEVTSIERVVRRSKHYVVAEKYEVPPKEVKGKLNPTSLKNA